MGLTTTRYIRWDDPGALKLDGTAGSLYAILKHHLPLIGWSIAFDDPGNYKIAFRNSMAHGGSGGYLRVHDDGSFTGGGRVASWRAYETMSDIDTGTLMCCDDWVWKAREAGGAQGADAVRRCYIIIADERTIYLSTWVGDDGANPRGINPTPPNATGNNATNSVMMAFAGDIQPFIAGDLGFGGCGMTSQNPGTTASASVASWLGSKRQNMGAPTATTFCLSRDSSLAPVVTQVAVAANEHTGSTGRGHGNSGNPVINSNDPIVVIPALVCEYGVLRGRMRGLYAPLNDLATNGGAPMGEEITPHLQANSLNLVSLAGAISGSISGTARLFAETTKSWDDI